MLGFKHLVLQLGAFQTSETEMQKGLKLQLLGSGFELL